GYILFFIFIFPMIFEYVPMLGGGAGVAGYRYSSPIMAIIYLSGGLIAWSLFIIWYYRSFIKPMNQEYNNVASVLRDGVRVKAHIESVHVLEETPSYKTVELELSMKNLSGTTILYPYEINDTKPYENRYPIGKSLDMRIDPQIRSPYILPEHIQVERNNTFKIYFLGFVCLVIFCVAYLVFSYWLQSNGAGWRFLHFWHPWVTIPLWGLFFGWLIMGVVVGGLFGENEDEVELIFKGKEAAANVLKAEQTGTYINELPEIKFEIEFSDQHGITHRSSFKKIVNLMDLHQVGQKDRVILYLPEDPQKTMLADRIVKN